MGLCSFLNAASPYTFVLSPNLLEAQKHIAALRLDKGKALVEAEKQANKMNMAVYLFDNYIDFYKVLCLNKKEDYLLLSSAKSSRLDALKKIDDKNPYKLFAQAEIHLQNAFLKGMFEEYLGAAWDLKSCYQLLEENTKKFPNFITNKKDLGFLKAILGTVPESYQWIVSISGMKADLNGGLNLLKEYIDKADNKEILMEQKNAQYFYVLFNYYYLKNKTESWKMADKYTSDYKTNLLSTYIRAYAAKGTDNNQLSLVALTERPTGHDYMAFPYLEMLHGVVLLNKLDFTAAQHFKRYLSITSNKKLHQDAYVKLSWCAWLKGDTSNYLLYRKIASNISTIGGRNKLASTGGVDFYPEKTLLKARLLFDGGYFSEAENLLIENPISTFKTELEKTEYTYRLGRIYHESNKLSKAIEYLDLTIKANFKENEFMAANACLQLGFIYQKLNFKQLAKTYFEKVFKYKNYDSKNYLQQQAKAALAKL